MKNMISRFTLIILSTLLVISFNACDKETNEEEPPANTAPAASFTVQPPSGGTNTNFLFDASGSTDGQDALTALQFRWDYENDGTWDTQYSNDTNSHHKYTAEGTYEVKLEVKDTGGLTGQATKSVTVTDAQNNPPDAPGNPSPANGATGVGINQVLSWTCTDPDGDPLKYDVYFGISNNPAIVASDISASTYDPGQLQENTTYYWKILAKDNQGNSTPGSLWEFTSTGGTAFVCGNPFTDPRNGKQYPTVMIGNACWMAKNMDIGAMIDGSQNQSNNGDIEKYCYDNIELNCTSFGGLYQWDEMMQYVSDNGTQGICPGGWHIPTDVEYMELEMAVGMPQSEVIKTGLRGTDEGTKLKEGGSSGFEGLMGGYYSGGQFFSKGSYGTFFSAEGSANLAWTRYLFNDMDQVLRDKYEKSFAMSVRCVKDAK